MEDHRPRPLSSQSPEVRHLLEALGLHGKGVTELVIRFATNEIVTVTATCTNLHVGQANVFTEWTKQFALVPKDQVRSEDGE